MPYWLNVISERPDEAIEQARNDTIERAKDVWGLDYADPSDGLYPSGNQIGRTQFRPGHTYGSSYTWRINDTAGGQWLTTHETGGAGNVVVATGATGWNTVPWLQFVLTDDNFIIVEGFFSTDANPTIRETHLTLSGVTLPVMQIEEIYASEEETNKGYLEVPAVISPKSELRCDIRSNIVGNNLNEGFGILGETVGKRAYLIRELY